MTSPDGITWTARAAAETHPWSSITYGNGLFVATTYDGSSNQVMTSPDGITWTARAVSGTNQWQSITYGNGLFVAVAEYSDQVMTSPDGITWTLRTAHSGRWFSITYGNGLFVALAYTWANQVMTSPDGITWTLQTPAVTASWFGVTYGNGLFVAVASSGTSQVMTSPAGRSKAMNVLGDMDIDGVLRLKSGQNSTAAFQVQNAASINVFSVDTVNSRVVIGAVSAPTLPSASLIVSNAEVQATIRIGNSTDGVDISGAGGVTYKGTARPTRSIVLSPEYAGATLSADGSFNTLGSMTAENSGSSDGWKNYYTWTTTQATAQDYTVMVRVTLPTDFDSWDTNALAVAYRTGVSGTTNNSVSLLVNNVSNSPGTPMCSVSEAASTSWANATCGSSSLSNWNTTNKTAVLRIKVKATNTSNAMAQLGDITLQYKSKF